MFSFGIGEAAGLATALVWAMSCLIHVQVSRMVGPTKMMILRLPLGSVVFILLTWACGQLHSYPLLPSLIMAASGIFGIALGDWLFYTAAQMIGSRPALVCQALYAAMAALMGIMLLGESFSLRIMAGIALITGGVIVVILAEKASAQGKILLGTKIKGLLLALASALCLALGMILSKYAMSQGIPSMAAGMIRTLTALLLFMGLGALRHEIGPAVQQLREQPQIISKLLWGCALGTVGGLWLSLVALSHTTAGIASVLMSLEAVFLPFLLWPLEKRFPSGRVLFGTLLAFFGSALILTL